MDYIVYEVRTVISEIAETENGLRKRQHSATPKERIRMGECTRKEEKRSSCENTRLKTFEHDSPRELERIQTFIRKLSTVKILSSMTADVHVQRWIFSHDQRKKERKKNDERHRPNCSKMFALSVLPARTRRVTSFRIFARRVVVNRANFQRIRVLRERPNGRWLRHPPYPCR